MLEAIQLSLTLFSSGILTAIYFKLGTHTEKHKSHERRLDILEGKMPDARTVKRA